MTPSETGQKLSGWFHDYLWHSSLDMRTSGKDQILYQEHPLLEDRLKRYSVPPYGNVYIGCWNASSLYADLMRSVNIPIKKVTHVLEDPNGVKNQHSGLAFDWQGSGENSRYLLHTDDLFLLSDFTDPAPAPKETPRGVALWNHGWLNASGFEKAFSYSHQLGIFEEAAFSQQVTYHERGQWLMPSAKALEITRSLNGRQPTHDYLKRERNLSEKEAEDYWKSVENTVLSYGDGNMNLGYQHLLDGQNSRHAEWCKRTGKCS